MRREWNPQLLVVCFVIVMGVAAFGSIFTGSGIKSEWYESVKPSITPPDWLFGPIWTILFILIAFSLYFAWNGASTTRQRKAVGMIYGFNLILNALWSVFYFGFQSVRIAFIDIALIWISIIFAISLSTRLDKKAAWLLVPYLLWVSFAAILNFLSI